MAKSSKKKQSVKMQIKPTFKVENIVASASLGLELDLYTIASRVDDVEYEPEQFPGAILKLKEPKTSLLLFKNGKIICTGGKNEADVGAAIEKTLKMLINFSTTKPPRGFKPTFVVQNIVASAALGVELDLYSIASEIDGV